MSATLLQRHTEACNFPGVLDEARVEESLKSYLKALGIDRKVVRIRAGWRLEEHPDLKKQVNEILDDAIRRNPSLALDASDALDALDASDARAARAALDALAASEDRKSVV